MKRCKKCGIEKTPSEFYKKPDSKDRLQSSCKVCWDTRQNEWNKANPEQRKLINRRANHRMRTEDPRRFKSYRLMRDFKITLADFEAILESQGNRCAICRCDEREAIRKHRYGWAVDHDHSSKAVRGILCCACNIGIGLLGDSAHTALSAHEYLARTQPREELSLQ